MKIVRETATHWWINCAHPGCTHEITVSRKIETYRGDVLQFRSPEEAAAYGFAATRCVDHPALAVVAS